MNDHPIIRLATRKDAEAIALESMADEEEVAHLVLFAVREDMRRRGIGSALLAWLEKVASVAGVGRFRVEARLTNAGARAFYRKHGYVEREIVPAMYRDTEDG